MGRRGAIIVFPSWRENRLPASTGPGGASRIVGTWAESLAAGSVLWFLFRNEKGVAQPEHLSQSSTQGRPAPEAGMGWLRTSTAPPEAPRPHTTIPDSPKKRSVGNRNRSVRSVAISSPVPPTNHHSLFSVRLKALQPLTAPHWKAPLKLQVLIAIWESLGFEPVFHIPGPHFSIV